MTPLLTTQQVAAILNRNPGTVANWRVTGDGPVYVSICGRFAGYKPEDVERFIDEGRRDSTSAEQPPRSAA